MRVLASFLNLSAVLGVLGVLVVQTFLRAMQHKPPRCRAAGKFPAICWNRAKNFALLAPSACARVLYYMCCDADADLIKYQSLRRAFRIPFIVRFQHRFRAREYSRAFIARDNLRRNLHGTSRQSPPTKTRIPPTISPGSKASKRCGIAPECISAMSVAPDFSSCAAKCSTTRPTKRWADSPTTFSCGFCLTASFRFPTTGAAFQSISTRKPDAARSNW